MYYDMTMNWLDFGFRRSKDQVTTGPNMGNSSIKSSIKMYQVALFVNGKSPIWAEFLKIRDPKVKYQGHQMTKYGQKYSFEV